MSRELTITVEDSVYETLQSMVEQQTISDFLKDLLKSATTAQSARRSNPGIASLRGTLKPTDTSDIRDEEDRPL
jgi:predicted CopG family antitoxin